MLQNVLVALLVAGSASYSAWRLAPSASRLRLLERVTPPLTSLLGSVAAVPLARLRSRVLSQVKGGCASCSSAATHHRVVKR